jgi:hypothetical protein
MDQASAVISKRKAAWDGIKLEHCQLRAGELITSVTGTTPHSYRLTLQT